MLKTNSLISGLILVLGGAVFVSGQSVLESDTLVLNQTEFLFPETHPGEVFIVRKVIVGTGKSLRKSTTSESSSDPATFSSSKQPHAPLANRDLRGRFVRTGEYQKRVAQIQQKLGLPLGSASVHESGRPFKAPRSFEMPAGARPKVMSNSPRIKTGRDLEAMEKAEHAAVRRRYGALSPEFTREVEAMKDGDEMEVTIELAIKSPGFINGLTATLEERKANARAWARAKPLVSGAELVQRQGLKRSALSDEGGARTERLVEVRASKATLKRLARLDEIVSITPRPKMELASVPGLGSVNLQDLINSAYNPPTGMVNSYYQPVATMEFGLTQNYLNCVSSNPSLVPQNINLYVGPHSSISAHSEETYTLMALGSPNDLHYHFKSPRYVYSAILDSILTYGISSIGASMIVGRDQVETADSRFVDRMAYIFPYPLISNPTGNAGHQYVPRNLTYNSLNVGNVQHYDNHHFRVDYQGFIGSAGPVYVPNSQSTNPPAVYGSVPDWELPSLVAPGFTPDPWWGYHTPCIYGNNALDLWSNGPGGTSLSAPIAAAMAANVMGARNSHSTSVKPTETRAILMLTAENVDSGYWRSPTTQDSRDGAGTISGTNAVKFALEATDVYPGDGPAVNGIAWGYLTRDAYADQNVYSPQNYMYEVPAEIPEGKHLRFVLTWTSSPGVNVDQNRVADLDLWVETGDTYYISDTWNGNVEIVDIPDYAVNPGGVYSLMVVPMIFRAALDGPEEGYFTVAWTWVKNHAD